MVEIFDSSSRYLLDHHQEMTQPQLCHIGWEIIKEEYYAVDGPRFTAHWKRCTPCKRVMTLAKSSGTETFD